MRLASCTPMTAKIHGGEWGRIVTPLQVSVWEKYLARHPDREFAMFIVDGLRGGFRIGFDYRACRCAAGPGNMKSVDQHADIVDRYIHEEKGEGRLLGPFQRSAVPEIHISPFGVIPKSEPGKWRLILNLSSPGGKSVNDGICKEWCSLSYLSVDRVVGKVIALGTGTLLAKFDLKAAYRNVPIHPDDRWMLGMAWEDQVYVDIALPFGLRSAPIIFSALADALEFAIRSKGVKEIGHYLDDFVIVGPPKSAQCSRDLQKSLETCVEMGFPVAEEKTRGPATMIRFLGVELDTERLELRLPAEKLIKLREIVGRWRKRKGCTKKELRSLAGHLAHACTVVRPGRRFLRGLFGLLSQYRKEEHMIRLNAAFRADLEWWHVYIAGWNGVSMMLKESWQLSGVEIWSDASGSWGCGAFWDLRWFQVGWEQSEELSGVSIAAKELLPIVVAVAIWGELWSGSVVLCHCDNQAAVAAVRGGYCRDPAMAHMLRCLFFLEAKFNITLTAVHVPGVQNGVADAISRNKLNVFFDLVPQASKVACQVPPGLVERLGKQGHWTPENWTSWLETLSRPQ